MLKDFFYGTHIADRAPALVVDVGCSLTGVSSDWNFFGRALRGVGFDALEPEVARLKGLEKRQHIHYEAAIVGLTREQELQRLPEENLPGELYYPHPFSRSSAVRAAKVKNYNYTKEIFNAGAVVKHTDRRISIDEWSAETKSEPCILKVDVDGPDFEVLLGASDAIGRSVLALHLECNFQSTKNPYHNCLSRTQQFLHRKGFSIFNMLPFRYSRAALPAPFIYNELSATTTGQLVWADVLFIRDLAAPGYEDIFNFEATPERIIATACAMEQFGLQDCAVELLQTFADRLPYSIEDAINAVPVPADLGGNLSYSEYIAKFEDDPTALLLKNRKEPTPTPFKAKKSTSEIDLADAITDQAWGTTVMHASAQRLHFSTAARAYTYSYIVKLPSAPDAKFIELDLVVSSGQIGVAIVGETLNDLFSEVWLSADSGTQVVVLPIPDAPVTGLIFRNGENKVPSMGGVYSARFLTSFG